MKSKNDILLLLKEFLIDNEKSEGISFLLNREEADLEIINKFIKEDVPLPSTDNYSTPEKNTPRESKPQFGQLRNKYDKSRVENRPEKPAEIAIPENLESIRDYISNCNKCNEIDSRKFSVGTGANGVMIILNAPTMMTTLEKNIYKKDSIELLRNLISAMELEFNDCYIANLIKCETNHMLNSPSQMFKACEDLLVKEINLVHPRVIIVMGDMLPLGKISRQMSSIGWYNIDHPITILKNPALKRKTWDTLKQVMNTLSTLK